MKSFKIILMVALTIFSVSVFAQAKEKKEKQLTDTTVVYSCPMHPEVTMKHKGTCSKCGMNLTAPKKTSTKKEATKHFACPMHPSEKSDKAGKCSKCGMNLEEQKS